MEDDEARSLIARLTDANGHAARVPLRARLRELGGEAAAALVEALAHESSFTRWEAVNLLGEMALPGTMEAVLSFALAEDEVHARWRSFWATCRFERERTLPLLFEALAATDFTRRYRAALILSMLGEPAAAPALLEGLSTGNPWIQWEALSALKSLRLASTEEAIASFLAPEKAADLRQEAVLALGAIRSPTAIARVVQALADPAAQVRWRASLVLGGLGHRELAGSLRERLTVEEDAEVRSKLAEDIARLEEHHGRDDHG